MEISVTAGLGHSRRSPTVSFRATATKIALSQTLKVTLAVDQPPVTTLEVPSIPDMISERDRQINGKSPMAAYGISRRFQ